MSVSGPRNRRNESAKFLELETDKMVQFLGPETVFYGRVELYPLFQKVTKEGHIRMYVCLRVIATLGPS